MKVFAMWTIAILGASVLILERSVGAQTPDRLTDPDVKTLIETVAHSCERFQDELDGKLKDSILRGPAQEMHVEKFLDDFKDNIEHLKDRFEAKYAASEEAATVLRQGTAVDRFMAQQPADLNGASEWHHLAGDLNRLATAYGTKFPLQTSTVTSGPVAVRRINDGEAAVAAEKLEEQADEIKDAVDKEHALAEPTKDRLRAAADLVKERADTLKSRLEDAKPATSEAKLLFDAVRRLEDASKSVSLSSPSLTAMGRIKAPLETLYRAFGID